MKFGVRECCDVVLKAKATQKIGNQTFKKGDPVIYFDTVKTSTTEGASTTVYAQGGRGNARLLAWEGERTLTFTMEDALISPKGLAILTGADLMHANGDGQIIYGHTTSQIEVKTQNIAIVNNNVELDKASAYFMVLDNNGEMAGVPVKINTVAKQAGNTTISGVSTKVAEIYGSEEGSLEGTVGAGKITAIKNVYTQPIYLTLATGDNKSIFNPDDWTFSISASTGAYALGVNEIIIIDSKIHTDDIVFVDYYKPYKSDAVQIDITPDKFGGYYYMEASTLFKREADGYDLPAEIIIPKCKIQSNFSFTLASSGDPSTFTFTMDAFPDYTQFDRTKKVLCSIQILEADDNYDLGEESADTISEYQRVVYNENPGTKAPWNGYIMNKDDNGWAPQTDDDRVWLNADATSGHQVPAGTSTPEGWTGEYAANNDVGPVTVATMGE